MHTRSPPRFLRDTRTKKMYKYTHSISDKVFNIISKKKEAITAAESTKVPARVEFK